MAHKNPEDHDLAAEARILARYLIGKEIDVGQVERYRRAVGILAIGNGSGGICALGFALRHPRLIGLLDAAGALSRRSTLHERLLILSAILECTPDHCNEFLSDADSVPSFSLAALAALGAAAKLVVGAVAIRLIRR